MMTETGVQTGGYVPQIFNNSPKQLRPNSWYRTQVVKAKSMKSSKGFPGTELLLAPLNAEGVQVPSAPITSLRLWHPREKEDGTTTNTLPFFQNVMIACADPEDTSLVVPTQKGTKFFNGAGTEITVEEAQDICVNIGNQVEEFESRVREDPTFLEGEVFYTRTDKANDGGWVSAKTVTNTISDGAREYLIDSDEDLIA